MGKAEIRGDSRANFIQRLTLFLIDGSVKLLRSDAVHINDLFEASVNHIKELYEKEMEVAKKYIEASVVEAKKEGIRQGLSRFKELLTNFILERDKFFKRMESELATLVVPICEKVIERELRMDRSTLLSIIKREMSELFADSVTVLLNEEDYNEIQEFLPVFFEEMKNYRIQFLADKGIPPNSCVLKCSSGEIDAGIKTRLKRINDIVNNEF